MQYRTREKWAILRNAWISANTNGTIELQTESHREARNLRGELYRCARRKDLRDDPAFHSAVCDCAITIPAGSSTVIVYRRTLDATTQAIARQVTDNDAKCSEERIAAGLAATPPSIASLPSAAKHSYFNRED